MNQSLHTAVFDESFPAEVKPTADFKFADVANFEEMFLWIKNIVPDALGLESGSNGGSVMEYNKVIGRVRLRQVRVQKNKGCQIPKVI